MKNLTIKQVAFFSVVFFGWALVAGAVDIPVSVTTSSAADALTLGISETLTTNVGTISGVGNVNEIDIRVTSIGGTYLGGTQTIPATTGINNIAGMWTFIGGSAYIPASRSAPALTQTVNGAGNPTPAPQIGGVANSAFSEINFDTIGPAPSLAATGAMTANTAWYGAGTLAGGWYTTFQNCNINSTDATPGGTWGVSGTPAVPTGFGFDNTLLAAFYVSPSVTGVEFYTTDGNAFGGTGTYSQFGFNYGGGRTDYVQIKPVPEPATMVLLAAGLAGLLAYAWRKHR